MPRQGATKILKHIPVGTSVLIRDWRECEGCKENWFDEDMYELCGETHTIVEANWYKDYTGHESYEYVLSGIDEWVFSKDMLIIISGTGQVASPFLDTLFS